MKASDFKNKADYSFEDLVELVHFLRSENGCPWDREQTYQSMRKPLLEETYEVIDALDNADFANLKEELGDLLLQVLFNADMAAVDQQFTLQDVIQGLSDKLITRHSHIFGNDHAANADEVKQLWEINKQKEKQAQVQTITGSQAELLAPSQQVSRAFAKISKSSSSLHRSVQIKKIAAKNGFEWSRVEDIHNKVKEELQEVIEAGSAYLEEEIGDLLFTVSDLARFYGVDPDLALNKVNYKVQRRIELYLELQNKNQELSPQEIWQMAKVQEYRER